MRSSSKNSTKSNKKEINFDPKLENPYKINYWTKDDKIVDDGTIKDDVTNMLRRKVSELRSQLSKLTVAYNDLKSQSSKEISRLKSIVEVEKQRRLNAQEDKLERSSALMQELVERDKKIVQL